MLSLVISSCCHFHIQAGVLCQKWNKHRWIHNVAYFKVSNVSMIHVGNIFCMVTSVTDADVRHMAEVLYNVHWLYILGYVDVDLMFKLGEEDGA